MDDTISSSLDPFFRRIERRDSLAPVERRALLEALSAVATFKAGEDIVREGERPSHCTLLVSGFTARYRMVANGERQFSAIHVPGDFIDLHSFPLKEMDHSVAALSPCTVALFPHAAITALTETYPHLTRLLWLLTLLDSALQREWIMCLGRLSATARAAHLFCELGMRLSIVGEGDPDRYWLPLTQQDLADSLGLSAVHANRVVQTLRGEGLLTWQNEQVTLPNLERVRALGEFEDRYLHLIKEPR